MKYCSLELADKKVAINALSELIEKNVNCVIATMKEHKANITDLIREHRIFEFIEQREAHEEVEDRFSTSCANQIFKSLVENHTYVRNENRSTKTIPRYWRSGDQACYEKIKNTHNQKDSTPVPV